MQRQAYHYLSSALDAFCDDKLPTIQTDFDLPFVAPPTAMGFSRVAGERSFDTNARLRQFLGRTWPGMSPAERREAVYYYVRDWGGVKGHLDETLPSYADRTEVEIVTHSELDGVASWSKVLSFRMRSSYAILDARVAAALNAIQVVYGSGLTYRFPKLPSKSSKVVPFDELLDDTFPDVPRIGRTGLYLSYCDLLQRAFERYQNRHSSGLHWHAVETALFFHSPQLMACAVDHPNWQRITQKV